MKKIALKSLFLLGLLVFTGIQTDIIKLSVNNEQLNGGAAITSLEGQIRSLRAKLKRTKGLTWVEAISTIPAKYGVPKSVVEIIIAKESGGDPKAIRFEPHYVKRCGKYKLSKEETRLCASSHSVFQVMGTHYYEAGMDWRDAYDPETATEMAMRIWAKCSERHKEKDRYENLRSTAECYNGSKAYASDFMQRLSKALINSDSLNALKVTEGI